MGLSYKDSGVNIQAGDRFVKKIAPIASATFSERVITGIGGFGALFSGAFPEYEDPILVAGTDGVGTKLKIAQMMGKHDTVGIDAVAMCVNDIVVSGAKPLFFLDYIACGRLDENVLVDIVKGLAEGCGQAGLSLIGGETAEHPDLMAPDDYDIAGFAVGVADRKKIIDGRGIVKGDMIIGLASSGIHSNGYSLVRKLFFEMKHYSVDTRLADLDDTLGSVLLTPTKIYAKSIMNCVASGERVKGLVHITGGGFYENIPRVMPKNRAARIERGSFYLPPIFSIIQREGAISDREMFTTFNMGIGMMLVCAKEDADKVIKNLKSSGESARIIGSIVENAGEPVQIV
ncbi:MAG: phosphoribosylformylglycinamidine cyclo-ligase [Spirochaetes bacterium RBG_16_49_21]|nr:MAG: phosphoribosylformylglycinamidine cyclo-ligase [Spirochaetes bacterium RBG_16_49_21]